MIPNLLAAQRRVVQGLHNTGPSRWVVRSSNSGNSRFVREIASAYMQEALSAVKMLMDVKVRGVVVCPAADMHHWYRAGWQGAVVASSAFMRDPAPSSELFDAAVFDEQIDYPDKYLVRLREFLQVHARIAVFLLPPDPSEELVKVLSDERFVSLKID